MIVPCLKPPVSSDAVLLLWPLLLQFGAAADSLLPTQPLPAAALPSSSPSPSSSSLLLLSSSLSSWSVDIRSSRGPDDEDAVEEVLEEEEVFAVPPAELLLLLPLPGEAGKKIKAS